jgi:putative ATP-dependent endonuclease of the OLD family
MRIVQFSVRNYRSITVANKIKMGEITTLVGKNNEGKSNILRALAITMKVLQYYSHDPRPLSPTMVKMMGYDWHSDFPVSLQEQYPDGSTIITIDFALNETETAELRALCSVAISQYVPIRVSYNSTLKIEIPKKGTPAFSNPDVKKTIIKYVCQKIDINHIPAIRTTKDSMEVVRRIISYQLNSIEDQPEYTAAMNIINSIRQSSLDSMATELLPELTMYLPEIQSIKLSLPEEKKQNIMYRDIDITIDDGCLTSLDAKGDGVKSLVAMAMLSLESRNNLTSVVAIEEPESHLHPYAARKLLKTIEIIGRSKQVILTTHSPLFIRVC